MSQLLDFLHFIVLLVKADAARLLILTEWELRISKTFQDFTNIWMNSWTLKLSPMFLFPLLRPQCVLRIYRADVWVHYGVMICYVLRQRINNNVLLSYFCHLVHIDMLHQSLHVRSFGRWCIGVLCWDM